MIIAEHLNFSYSNGSAMCRSAIRDVSFSVSKGETIGIIGETGSGKSTLLQLVGGLLAPESGSLTIDGKVYAKGRDQSLFPTVGYLFQYPEHQLFAETVEEDIAYGLKNMGLSDDEIKARVLEMLKEVGLSADILETSPFTLSGGQKRRVAIAGVLAVHPKILILDEPTSGLDPKGKKEMLTLFCTYKEKYRSTVLWVSHDMQDIAEYADRVMLLYKGEKIAEATPDELFADAECYAQYGLDVPPITRIMTALQKENVPVSKGIIHLSDAVEEIARAVGREAP